MTTFSSIFLLSKLQKQQTQVKSISNVTVNAQNVRHLRLHKLADASWNSRSTCRLRLVVTRPRSSQALTSVPGCPSAADSRDRSLQHRPSNMIVKRIHVRATWRLWSLSIKSRQWAACKPLLSHFCRMRQHSILSENKLLAKQDLLTLQNRMT